MLNPVDFKLVTQILINMQIIFISWQASCPRSRSLSVSGHFGLCCLWDHKCFTNKSCFHTPSALFCDYHFIFTGTNKPDCDHCQDNPRRKCKHCACCVCGGKHDPDKQILCDECDDAFHLGCLNPPLEKIPEEDEW